MESEQDEKLIGQEGLVEEQITASAPALVNNPEEKKEEEPFANVQPVNVGRIEKQEFTDKTLSYFDGTLMIIINLSILLILAILFVIFLLKAIKPGIITTIVLLVVFIISFIGFKRISPNSGKVFYDGYYMGTIKTPGIFFLNPGFKVKNISLKMHSLKSEEVLVTDKLGNSIRMASVVNWRVVDCAKAVFEVENYEDYVKHQTENSMRYIASQYPYEQEKPGDHCLRLHHNLINNGFQYDLERRLAVIGIAIESCCITELSVSPEVAGNILRKQRAEALNFSKEKMVKEAVEFLGNTIKEIESQDICKLDDNAKAELIGRVMASLCK